MECSGIFLRGMRRVMGVAGVGALRALWACETSVMSGLWPEICVVALRGFWGEW